MSEFEQEAQAAPTVDYAKELETLKQSFDSYKRDTGGQLRAYQDQFQLMQAQFQQSPKEEQISLSDDDIPSWGLIKKSAEPLQKEIEGLKSELNQLRRKAEGVDPVSLQSKHSDFDDVVKTYLPKYIAKNPQIASYLRDSQDYELAYRIAKSVQSEEQAPKMHEHAARITKNEDAIGSLSSVGHTSPISQARRWREMSAEDFMREANKNIM